jgi:hypothetical protein
MLARTDWHQAPALQLQPLKNEKQRYNQNDVRQYTNYYPAFAADVAPTITPEKTRIKSSVCGVGGASYFLGRRLPFPLHEQLASHFFLG